MPRDKLLSAVRAALGRDPRHVEVAPGLLSPGSQPGVIPRCLATDPAFELPLATLFGKRLKDIGGSLILCNSIEDQIAATINALARESLERFICGPEADLEPLQSHLREGTVPRSVRLAEAPASSREAFHRFLATFHAAVTVADAALADTGSLVYLPSPARPKSLLLLPEVQIVWLRASRLFPSRPAWIERFLGSDRPPLPGGMLFVAGSSVTADIEKILIRPAQGPREVMVVMRREG